jgi:hypothetical protein
MTDIGAEESPFAERETGKGTVPPLMADTAQRDRFHAQGQAKDLLRKFREATGRDPETVSELADWISRRIG